MLAVSKDRESSTVALRRAFKLSHYDQVSSWLWALTFCLTALLMVLIAIWFRPPKSFPPHFVPITWVDDAGESPNPDGIAEDFRDPGVEELFEVTEPQIAESIAAVTEAVSTIQAHHERVEGLASEMGAGLNKGDRRQHGREGVAGPVDRPHERWQIRYSTVSRDEYAKQLDFFGIELGAVSRAKPSVVYLADLAAERPNRREGRKSQERRIFFSHRPGRLREWDLSLLLESGELEDDPEQDYVMVHFYPDEVRERLLDLEQAEIGDRELGDISRTTFGVKQSDRGFEYFVIDVKLKNNR